MPSGIPLDANYKNLSCQLGGLHLNGIVTYPPTVPVITGGTAQSLTVLSIDDPAVSQLPSAPPFDPSTVVGYLQVKLGNINSIGNGDFTKPFYIPLYQ